MSSMWTAGIVMVLVLSLYPSIQISRQYLKMQSLHFYYYFQCLIHFKLLCVCVCVCIVFIVDTCIYHFIVLMCICTDMYNKILKDFCQVLFLRICVLMFFAHHTNTDLPCKLKTDTNPKIFMFAERSFVLILCHRRTLSLCF